MGQQKKAYIRLCFYELEGGGLVIRFGLKLASGKLGLIWGHYQKSRTVKQLGILKILFWRQEKQNETRDDVSMKVELTQKKELLVVL